MFLSKIAGLNSDSFGVTLNPLIRSVAVSFAFKTFFFSESQTETLSEWALQSQFKDTTMTISKLECVDKKSWKLCVDSIQQDYARKSSKIFSPRSKLFFLSVIMSDYMTVLFD